jgi:UDP-glucose:(galactosyl)LPS alpha-1,2-glucosyltransferase
MSATTVPIVFAFDGRVLRPAAVAISSLIEEGLKETTYQIHILHPGFTRKVKEAFADIAKGTRHTVVFHEIDNKRFKGLPSGRGSWTEVVYYRFLIPELLQECERAIYSDIDVYFKGDLSSLIELDMKGAPIGAVVGEVNGPAMKCHNYFPENTSEHIYMSGFLLMDLGMMRKEELTERLLETAKSYGKRLKMFDLDALNLTCSHIHSLPFEYCVLETVYEEQSVRSAPEFSWLSDHYSIDDLEGAKANTKIIHYAGPLGKPWRRANQPSYYKQALKRVPAALNRKTLRDIRKYWTSRLANMVRDERTPR